MRDEYASDGTNSGSLSIEGSQHSLRGFGRRSNLVCVRLPIDLEPIAPLIRRIVERLDPEEIWLFGSRAEGRARPDSDYDLLAVLGNDASEGDLDLVKAWELTCGLGIPADLVPCTRSDFEGERDEIGTLPRAAYHRGRRIYERLPQGSGDGQANA
jgi:predicted nucleotidyltransferase